MTATQAGQGIIALACGHSRTLAVPDALAAAMLGGRLYCPQCSLDDGGLTRYSSIVKGGFDLVPAPDLAAAMRDRAAAALAEYEARKAAAPARKRGAMFSPEMAGLLSQALRGWLEATDE